MSTNVCRSYTSRYIHRAVNRRKYGNINLLSPLSLLTPGSLSLVPNVIHCCPHHTAVAKDETKHDFVWQPVSGTALIHGNPAVSGEL